MLSWPPATTISLSPLRMACAAMATERRPEPQTKLMVIAVVSIGRRGLDGRLPCGVLPLGRRQNLPHDHFGNVARLGIRALERLGYDGLAEPVGGNTRQSSVERTDRRARGTRDYDGFLPVHSCLLFRIDARECSSA